MRESEARALYWDRRDLLLEACWRLRDEFSASLEGIPGINCDFRVIELDDYLLLASSCDDVEQDVWNDSPELIVGTVSVTDEQALDRATELTAKLCTTHGGANTTERRIVCVIPPWAKPASWGGTIALPNRLVIRFVLESVPAQEQDAVRLSPFLPLSLALSGGGVRAAIYQLGALVVLAEQNRLKDVREVVSVSGGSILAAHFAKHWTSGTDGADGFRNVAAGLLSVVRSDIRHRIFIPWLWTRLLPWCWFSVAAGRTGRLKAEYERLFGSTTLGDLAGNGRPEIAIVATDAVRRDRVAFTTSKILRWPLKADEHGRYATPSPILSKGVELSLAVAASSCFPPVFPRLHLTHKDLGITYDEFKEDLELNDGGVLTNLGIEVLVALRELGWTENALILITDAERPLAVKPGRSAVTDIDASADALSASARKVATQEFGNKCCSIQFSDRAENPEGLSHRTETALAGYRTDLDAPNWQEIHALMIHGAMIANRALSDRLSPVAPAALKVAIAKIIVEAGGPSALPIPDEKDLAGCEDRPKWRLRGHGGAVAVVGMAAVYFFYQGLVALF